MGDYRDSAKGFVAFVMLQRNRKSYSFAEYMDAESGQVLSIKSHINPTTGLPVPRRFKWTSNQPVLKIPIKQKDVIEYLKNSPECFKSKNAPNPNAPKEHYMFALIDSEGDAKIALDAGRDNIKAQALAYSLEEYPEKLKRLARMVGEDSVKPNMQLLACTNYAKSNATKFIEMMEDEASEARELVKLALANGIIKKQGFMYRLGKVHVGSHNENDVVNKISGDPELFEALKMRLDGPTEEPVEELGETALPEEFADLYIKDEETDEGKTRAVK